MRIAIVGHFGGKYNFKDGQTVKTVSLYDALMRYGFEKIDRVDTFYIRKNPFNFFIKLMKSFLFDKKYILLLSDKGRKFLFPFFYVMSKIGKEVYHYGIGGRLAREVLEKPKWKKYVSSFKSNWLESKELVENLRQQGISNAVYIPNFKNLKILCKEELQKEYTSPYRLCTFSRVMREKGIEYAIESVRKINENAGKQLVSLDIYGQANKDYLDRLCHILESDDSCCYCGVVDADKVKKNLVGLEHLCPTV